jgi:hypothetical protein
VRRSVVDRPAHERVRLKEVVGFGGCQKSSPLVEPVSPSQVELLQVVVSALEAAPIERINAAVERIVVTRGDPPHHCHRSRMCRAVPGRHIIASVYAEQNRPLIVQFYGGIDAGLGVAVVCEHQRMSVQIVVGSELCFNVRRRNVAPDLDNLLPLTERREVRTLPRDRSRRDIYGAEVDR